MSSIALSRNGSCVVVTVLSPNCYRMNNLHAAGHWQTLLALIVLLIKDANMFSKTNYVVVGGVLVVTNCLMILILFLVC